MYPTAISKIIEAIFKLVFGLILAFSVIRLTNNPALASAAAMTAITIGTFFATLYLRIKYKKQDKKFLQNNREERQEITYKIIFVLL